MGTLAKGSSQISLTEIQAEIKNLPASEGWKLLEWLGEHLNEAWDKEIERDSSEGRLDHLIEEARADYKARRC